MTIPQIIITLAPGGDLQCELPYNGGRRIVAISQDSEGLQTISRILHSQLRGTIQCGEDGSPTQQQVTHWERHQEWPSDTCPLCRAEGRTLVSMGRTANSKWTLVGDGSCKARRVAPAGKARKLTARSATQSSALDLGLAI